MTFWILTLLLSLIAMGFICFPLFKSTVTARSELDSEQVLYEARLAEIEKDLELDRLDQVTAQAAKSEEARRLIKSSETAVKSTVSNKNKALVILAALSIPALSFPFYYQTGTYHFASATNVEEAAQTTTPSMDDLLKVAEQRLKDNPDDVNGWKVVAPVYVRMGRFEDAVNAYENVLRVEGRDSETLIKLADVYIEQSQGQINPQAQELVQEVLAIDSGNSIARFYTGIIALQNDKLDETRSIWQGMLDTAKGDEEWLPVVQGRLAELATLQQSAPALPELNDNTVKAIQEMAPEDRLEAIGQMVANLDEKLKEDPNNKEGWQRLIRSYIILGRSDDAKIALENASKYYSGDETFITSLKNMMASVENSSKDSVQ